MRVKRVAKCIYTYDGCRLRCSRPAFRFFLFCFFVNFNCIRNIGSVLCMSDILIATANASAGTVSVATAAATAYA